jgi:hypothetical protein
LSAGERIVHGVVHGLAVANLTDRLKSGRQIDFPLPVGPVTGMIRSRSNR